MDEKALAAEIEAILYADVTVSGAKTVEEIRAVLIASATSLMPPIPHPEPSGYVVTVRIAPDE